jgi:hypothetical protein
MSNIKNILFAGHSFDHDSGGKMVHYELCKILNEYGINSKIYCTQKIQNHVCNAYYDNDFPIDDTTVVIYSELIHGNPFNSKYSVRWILAPVGTFYDKSVYLSHYNKQDLVYYFNSELKFNEYPEKMGTVYKLLTSLYIYPNVKQTNFNPRHGTCFTYRKKRMHKDEIINIHPPGSFEINNDGIDHLQDNLIELFNKYKYFISYDPLTFITIMAALCGCISIVRKVDGLSKLDWIKTTAANEYVKYKGLDNLYGIAYGMEDIQYAEDTLSLAKDQWTDIQNFCKESTVIQFILNLQNFEKMENTVQNNFY